jgi:hypothetical protein
VMCGSGGAALPAARAWPPSCALGLAGLVWIYGSVVVVHVGFTGMLGVEVDVANMGVADRGVVVLVAVAGGEVLERPRGVAPVVGDVPVFVVVHRCVVVVSCQLRSSHLALLCGSWSEDAR